MSSVPSTQKAIIIQPGQKLALEHVPVPQLRHPLDTIIKIYSASQNPADWKRVKEWGAPSGVVVGSDIAGIVVAIGEDVENVKVDDRVTVCTFGTLEIGVGAFQEYTVYDSRFLIPIPDTMSFNEAAAIPQAFLTAALALYQQTKIPEPFSPKNESFPILIWGGSSSIGLYSIQLAKLSGLTVFTTSSPKNFDLVKSHGADHVFDYADSATPDMIRKLTENKLQYVIDPISEKGSLKVAFKCLSTTLDSTLIVLLPVPPEIKTSFPPSVRLLSPLLYNIRGKDVPYGGRIVPASPTAKLWGIEWCLKTGLLLKQGKIRPNPLKVLGGLEAVEAGFKLQEEGKISGYKLIYEIKKA